MKVLIPTPLQSYTIGSLQYVDCAGIFGLMS
jgi:hypothetical protein